MAKILMFVIHASLVAKIIILSYKYSPYSINFKFTENIDLKSNMYPFSKKYKKIKSIKINKKHNHQ